MSDLRNCDGCSVRQEAPDRREFVTRTFLAAVGALVSTACGDGEIGGLFAPGMAPPLPAPLLVVLGSFPALATVGGIARVDPATTRPIAVVRTGASTYLALSMICTHQQFQPIQILPGGFVCPNHGAEFNAAGERTGGPQTSDLREYTVALNEIAGTLTIT